MMETYKAPIIDIIEILNEGLVLTGSTGESYGDQEDFGGSWS